MEFSLGNMAFEAAFKKTMQHEGGYVNDPADAGGETYMGISRFYNPNWKGWHLIDSHKSGGRFPSVLSTLKTLPMIVKEFYKINYWNPWLGDTFSKDIPKSFPLQIFLNNMFDIAVNLGVMRAGMFLQQALNLLNRNQANFKDLVVDGKVGPKTIEAFHSLAFKNENEIYHIVKIMNILRGMHYIRYMKKSPTQERFARGWLNRITL